MNCYIEVNIFGDPSTFVLCSIHILGHERFLWSFKDEAGFSCIILVNESSSSPTINEGQCFDSFFFLTIYDDRNR